MILGAQLHIGIAADFYIFSAVIQILLFITTFKNELKIWLKYSF